MFDVVTTKTTIAIPALLMGALTDISAMGIHDICGHDASWFTAGGMFFCCL